MCHAVLASCLTLQMRAIIKERPSECTERGLCLFGTAVARVAIVVYRVIAVVFDVSIMLPLDFSVL